MALVSTHGLAQKLERISQALRELPDQNLLSLLRCLRSVGTKPKHSPREHKKRVLPPPPRDPREMDRDELLAYLQNSKFFPYKVDVLEFARRYHVPVNTRTPREEIIRLCLRMIHDIPRGFTVLRFLAERQSTVLQEHPRPLLH
jgi:hypothetical protein